MAELGVLDWLAVGLTVGMIAKFIAGGWDLTGCVVTVTVGALGALFAGWCGTELLGWSGAGHATDLAAAFVGATSTLWVFSTLSVRR